MSAPPPGWYADPAGTVAVSRWWDGERWTRWLSTDATAPDPTKPASADPGPPAEPLPAPEESDGLVRMPLAVALVVGTLLLAVVAVGAVASATTRGLPSGPAVPPPTRSAGSQVTYNPGSRAASVQDLKVTLPGAPYVCENGPGPALPSFDSVVVCNAPVHENYDGDADWSATTGVGVLPASLVVRGDAKATGDRAFASLRGQFFRDTTTTVTKRVAQPTDLAPAGRSVVVSGQVNYTVPGVPSRYDRLLLVVVALSDDRYGIVFSSRPDDTSKAVLTALDASLATVTTK